MSRNLILAIGTLLWTAVAVDMFAHLITGEWVIVAIAAAVGVGWTALLVARRRLAVATETART
jgi:hypothetical protein